jgi:FKBP-type peptidyl-prolyl cis-trans isomerase
MSDRRAARARLLLVALAAACGREGGEGAARPAANPDPAQNTYAPALGVSLPAFAKTQEGVYYQDVKPGTGTAAVAGRPVTVHYTGWLPDGSKFDSSRDHGEPLAFTLGGGQVIRGWEVGIQGMRVGGTRKLVIPAELAYGATPPGPEIPANSVLVFEVELLKVE